MLTPTMLTLLARVGWMLSLLVMGCALIMGSPLMAVAQPVAPSSAVEGAPLFELHCAGCHPGGSNIIRRGKNLKQRALKRYGYTTPAAIAQLITQGKGLMSAYADTLSPEDIQTLAQYVLDQADHNWQ